MKQATSPANPARQFHTQALQSLQAGRLDEGIALLEKALSLNPGAGEIHNDLGTAFWQKGTPEKAQLHYEKASKLSPKNPQVLNNFGSFLMAQGRLDDAEKFLKRALRLDPNHIEVLNNMGRLSYETGRMQDAETLLMEAIKRAPRWPNPHYNLGLILAATNRESLAEKAFKHVLSLNPSHADAACDLAKLLTGLFRDEESFPLLQRAVKLSPQNEEYRMHLITLLEKHSRIEEAEKILQEGLALTPDSTRFVLIKAQILRRKKDIDGAISSLEEALPGLKTDSPKNAALFFELGQLYDRAKRYQDAFKMLETGNNAQSLSTEAQEFDKSLVPNMIRKYRDNNTKDWFKSWTETPPLSAMKTPVFLVGFPRSGTTLLDQILSSHPDITVAEEKPALWKTVADIENKVGRQNYPSCLAELTPEEIEQYRQNYAREHEKYENLNRSGVFIDKLPLNLIHTALIMRLFPGAKFILALRHPCDSVLSCFMQNFRLNESMIHFLDLKGAARLYDGAFTLWEQDVDVFNPPVYQIRYEDVVADFKPTVSGLLDFLDLPWNDAVLEFDKTAKNRKALNTPSYRQVTEKIYNRASGRWLHYQEFMGDVPEILRLHAARFGYEN